MGWYGPQGDCGCCGDPPPPSCTPYGSVSAMEEVSGEWTYPGGASIGLTRIATTDSNAIAVTPGSMSTDYDWSWNVWVRASGDAIIFDYVDENNYHCALFEFTGGVGGTIKYQKVTGGSATDLASASIPSSAITSASGGNPDRVNVTICRDGPNVLAFIDGFPVDGRYAWGNFDWHGGEKLGVLSASGGSFDMATPVRVGIDDDPFSCTAACTILCSYVLGLVSGSYVLTVTSSFVNANCDNAAGLSDDFSVGTGACGGNYNNLTFGNSSGQCASLCNPRYRLLISRQMLYDTIQKKLYIRAEAILTKGSTEGPSCDPDYCGETSAAWESERFELKNAVGWGTKTLTLVDEFYSTIVEAVTGTWPTTVSLSE